MSEAEHSASATDTRIGFTFTVPPSPHAGHTVTVERKDSVEKHQAYWLRCECGASTTVGTYWLDRFINGREAFPWDTRFVSARMPKVTVPA